MSRTRVLHIVQNLNYGGMERLIAEIVNRVSGAQFENHVLTLQYLGRFSADFGGRVTAHQCPPMSRFSMLRPRVLARTIRAIAPDVVHTHSGVWYKATLAARLAGAPRIIHTEHGRKHPDPLSDRAIDRLAARRTDVVVAVSRPLAAHLREHVVGDATDLTVIPNGVDTVRNRPRPDDNRLRTELGIARDRLLIGSIGRLEPIKGHEVAIAAFAKLLRHWHCDLPKPVLVMVGSGSQQQSLRAQAAALGCAEAVHFLGWRDDIEVLHRAFDLFTMSSHSEGTSVSLLEAMSAGLCPVVTDVGGNREVLGPELEHRLVPPGSSDALAAAWFEALVERPEQRLADGLQARARIVDRFDVKAMVDGYERIYLQGVAGAPAPLRLLVADQITA